MNYKKNFRYFKSINVTTTLILTALCVIVNGVGAALGYAVFHNNMIVVGVCFGIGGAGLLAISVYLIVTTCRRPSDAYIDSVYQQLADAAPDSALNKVGLAGEIQLEIKPVVLSACVFEDIKTRYYLAKGKDKRVRSSNFANFVMLFTLEQIITYRSRFSLIRQEWEETVEEYYYDDIVTLATRSTVHETMFSVVHRDVFEITTSAGTVLTLPFENNQTAVDAILQIRKILRAKKRFK